MSHLIIAPVILPALLAPLLLLLARHDLRLQRILGLAGTLALLALAAILLARSGQGPAAYRLGDWPAPFGIILIADRLAALMLTLTATLALVIQAYAVATGWDAKGRHFHTLYLFQLMGLNGAFLTADLFNLFVFFEVLLIASYGLMIHGSGEKRLRAGIQYVAFNLVGSTLFLFALGTLYAVTGTLNMADLAVKIAALPAGDHALIRVAAVMLIGVFAIKGALVPLHFWLPGTYANAPGPVAALFAIMTKVGAYAILRTTTLILPQSSPAIGSLLADMLMPAAALTLVVGAIGTLGARSLPRLAAFAGLASIGTLSIAIAAQTPQATAAGLYYLIHSTLATAALFLVADQITAGRGSMISSGPRLAAQGMLATLYFATAIALAGLPPLSGFVGKLLILTALDGAPLLWTVILTTTFLMILGLSRAGSTLFWNTTEAPTEGTAQPVALSCIGTLLALLAALTLCAGPVTDWLTVTATDLHAPAAYIAANGLEALE